MRRKGRPKKQKGGRNPGKRLGRPRKKVDPSYIEEATTRPGASKRARVENDDDSIDRKDKQVLSTVLVVDDGMSEGLHMTTSQVQALGSLVACRECGEAVVIGVRPTTKGMISEFTVSCTVCEDHKSTNTPNLIRERKRKREKKDAMLQKTENINYAHVAAYLDNGLGYSGLRHYCKYFNARCLNEATFIVYARQVISDVVADTEESLLYSSGIVREVFKSQLETDGLIDLTVAFTTTYHQWGSDFCLVAGAVIELTTGLVLDYDVANMYCHVCKINAKKIVSMSPTEMTEWFNKHQDTCEIREWCDELDHDAEEGVREIEPKYLECFIAKKIWSRSVEKYGFRYTNLIHESDEKIHEELSRANVYEDIPILIDSTTSCFSRRKSEHARTSFQTKLKAKCPRERVQTKDRIMYVYAMSIPEYNKFAISSNIKLRQLVKELESGSDEPTMILGQPMEELEVLQLGDVKNIKVAEANGEQEANENEDMEGDEAENADDDEQEIDDPEEPVGEEFERQEIEEEEEEQEKEQEKQKQQEKQQKQQEGEAEEEVAREDEVAGEDEGVVAGEEEEEEEEMEEEEAEVTIEGTTIILQGESMEVQESKPVAKDTKNNVDNNVKTEQGAPDADKLEDNKPEEKK